MKMLRGKQKTFAKWSQCGLTAAIVIGLGMASTSAWSQNADDAVSVDLSVLNDGGMIANSPYQSYTGARGLLLPPAKQPVSKLFVAPANAPKLTQPKATVRKAAKAAPKKMAAPAPAPAPVPVAKVAKAAPAPMPAPAPEPVEVMKSADAPPPIAPAPPPAPAPEMVKKTVAPPPPPKVAEAPKPADAPNSASTANAAVDIKVGQSTRIIFADTATKIPNDAKDKLRALADGVRDKADFRLQLLAFAGADGLSASKARRMSLSRALSIRSFLIENGVRSTRIDVRALGNKTSEKPINRVDVNIAKR